MKGASLDPAGTWRVRFRRWREAASPGETALAAYAGVQTFLLLIRLDRVEVLFWWDRQAWPYILMLWIKNVAVGLAAFLGVSWMLRAALAPGMPGDRAGRFGTRGWLAFLLLLGTGIALRWILVDLIPPGVWVDWVVDARAVLVRPRSLPWIGGVPFGPTNRAFSSYVYLHYCSALFRVFGRGDLGLLAMSAVGGCVMLPAAAWLAWEVAGPRCALGALGLAAFTRWPLILSRWGWIGTLLIALILLAGAATLASLRTGRVSYALLAGLFAGLMLHTHPAALAILGGLGLFGLPLLRERDGRWLVAAALSMTLVVAAPFSLFFLRNPGHLGGHPLDVSIYGTIAESHEGPLRKAGILTRSVLSNAVLYTGIPIWTTDPNPRHILQGHAILNIALGVFFLIGSAASLNFARAGSKAHRLLFLLALGGLLAGILSYPAAAPNTFRSCGFLAPLLIWCALGVDRAIRWVRARAAARPALLWALVLVLALGIDAPLFLRDWPESLSVKAAFCYPETAAGRLLRRLTERPTVLDRSVIQNPIVVETLAAGSDAARPIPRMPHEGVVEVIRHPPSSDPCWIVTDAPGLDALRRAGWRSARGVALTQEFPKARIALVRPPLNRQTQ